MLPVPRVLFSCVLASLLLAPVVAASDNATAPKQAEPAGPASSSPPAEADRCEDAKKRLDARLEEIRARYEAERGRLRQGDNASTGAMTDEERKRQAYELEARERREVDAAHEQFQSECPPQGATPASAEPVRGEPAAAGPCGDASLAADFEARTRARFEEFRLLLDEKHKRFQERMRAAEAEFRAGNHTGNETLDFEARMERERTAFRTAMEVEERRFQEGMRAEKERFFRDLEAKCHPAADRTGTGAAPRTTRGDDAAMREIELIRMECEAKAHARGEALRAAGTDSPDAVVAEVRPILEACEARLRAAWAEKIGSRIEGRAAHERIGSWEARSGDGAITLQGRYVTLKGDPSTNTVYDIAIGGVVYIEHLAADGHLEHFDMAEAEGGSTLTATGEGLRMRLSDNPSGLLNLNARDGRAFLLRLPAHLTVSGTGSGWAIQGAGHDAFVRVAADASEWDGTARILSVQGEAVFMVKTDRQNLVLDKVANKHRDALVSAVEKKALGAEVTIAAAEGGTTVDETLVYDAVEVQVDKPSTDRPLSLTLSAESSEPGKTFVVNVDGALIGAGKEVALLYYDVDEETGEETRAEIRRAAGLADVLDASDDETAEYWIVEDSDGVQVLVSVPHWSTHRVEVTTVAASDGLFAGAPAPAVVAVVAAFVLVAALARRRA